MKYSKFELNLIRYSIFNLYKILEMTFRTNMNVLICNNYAKEYFEKYFRDKNYNKLDIIEKLYYNNLLLIKLTEKLMEKHNIFNFCNEPENNKYLFNKIFKNCDTLIQHVFINHRRKIGEFSNNILITPINRSQYYKNCVKSNHYSIKIDINYNKKNNIINTYLKTKKGTYKYTLKGILIENISKIKKYIISIHSIRYDNVHLYYDIKNNKIIFDVDKEFMEIYITKLNNNIENLIKNYIKFLEKYIDWSYILEEVKPCYYCGFNQNKIDISNFHYEFFMDTKELHIKSCAIVHYKECRLSNNKIINENFRNYEIIENYENVIIKVWKDLLKNNVNYYNKDLRAIIVKNNLEKLLPKQIIQLVYKYNLTERRNYLITFIQLKKKLNNIQNNMFKIVSDVLL